jgi:hypothetical protein
MEPAVIIQRAFRKWFYRNAVCCITLEKLKYPCFMYKSFGVNIFYDYLALNRYFTLSGKYTDPKTRKKYTNKEIERFYKELSLHFPNEKPNNINHLVRESLNYLNTHYNYPVREILYNLNNPYVYTFSLVPEEHQPSGTVNLDTLDTPYLSRSEELQPSGTVNFSTVNNFNFVTTYEPSGTVNMSGGDQAILNPRPFYEPSGTVNMHGGDNAMLEIRYEPNNQINIPLFDPTRAFSQ